MGQSHTTPSGKPRARALGVPFEGEPGPCNAITDVPGVAVGYATLIRGDGPRKVGKGPVRTGVTAILPRGLATADQPVMAGCYALNGNGELSGTIWVEESGECTGPITLTNTHSCGVARDATIQWLVRRFPASTESWSLPVAGETYDGELNDINGFHVTVEHVMEAIESAASGPLELGSLGGGTGMIAYEFKGGNGSASRQVTLDGQRYSVGVFLQANFGSRRELLVAGVPVGRQLTGGEVRSRGAGSVIVILATDAPLLPHQLKRLARRVPLGLARTGAVAHNGSGDIFLALSTANGEALSPGSGPRSALFLPNEGLDPLFRAVVEATEEAVIDAMIVNAAMTGCDGLEVRALPHTELQALLAAHGRLAENRSPG